MPRTKTEVTAEQIFEFARDGLGIAQMAEQLGLKYQGLYKRIHQAEDLKDALEYGRKLCQENAVSTIRGILLDPDAKEQNKIQAFDKLMRHTEVERRSELQTAVLGNLSDTELQTLRENMARRELESRLGKTSPVRESTEEPEKVEVAEKG